MRFERQKTDFGLADLSSVSPYRSDQPLINKFRLIKMLSKKGIPKDDVEYIEDFVVNELKRTKFGPYKKALLTLGVQIAQSCDSTGLFETFRDFSRGVIPTAIRDLARLGLFLTYKDSSNHTVVKLMLDCGAKKGLKICRDQALFRCVEYLCRDPDTREEAIIAAFFNHPKFKNTDQVLKLLVNYYDETVDIASSFVFFDKAFPLLRKSSSDEALGVLTGVYHETSSDEVKSRVTLALASALEVEGRSDFERRTDLYASAIYHELLLIVIQDKADKKIAREAQQALLGFGTDALEYVLLAINKNHLPSKGTKLLEALVGHNPDAALRWVKRNSFSLEEADVTFLGAFWRYLAGQGIVPSKKPAPNQSTESILHKILSGIRDLESERKL